MKKFILILSAILIFTSCSNNTSSDVSSSIPEESSSPYIEPSSVESVSSETLIPENFSEIATLISKKFSLRDTVVADENVVEGLVGIKKDMYAQFCGEVSYALDNFDTVLVFYTSSEEQSSNIVALLESAKEKYSALYLEKIKAEIENSVIFQKDGYVIWLVAKNTENAVEIISEML